MDQPVHVGAEGAAGVDFRGVAEGQGLKLRRQFFGPRHGRAVDENRDDRDPARQRQLDLGADEIPLVVQPPPAFRTGRGEPPLADDGEDDLALGQLGLDVLPEVHPVGDGVHIYENGLRAEAGFESVVDPAGDVGAVVAAVGDEDLAHCPLPQVRARVAQCGRNVKRRAESATRRMKRGGVSAGQTGSSARLDTTRREGYPLHAGGTKGGA
jgi:hypothetical protein